MYIKQRRINCDLVRKCICIIYIVKIIMKKKLFKKNKILSKKYFFLVSNIFS